MVISTFVCLARTFAMRLCAPSFVAGTQPQKNVHTVYG